ncbi:MAG: polyribonucleotide nucleotidyltransferase [Patescibacteria group bacterium]
MDHTTQSLNRKIFKTTLGGAPLELEVSELARQANAAVLGRLGETAVLATVVMGAEDRVTDYFPLTVDYEERFYAAGKIIGSRFIRREGRASDEATLSARLIDRTVRPLFDQRLRREVQVTVTILAYDEQNDPDAIALIATSTALAISNIPWGGPVAGARFETKKDTGELDSLAFFAGTADKVNMIEFEGDEKREDEIVQLFEEGHREIQRLVAFQEGIVKEIGKPKLNIAFPEPDPAFVSRLRDFLAPRIDDAIQTQATSELKSALIEHLKTADEPGENLARVDELFEAEIDAYVHRQALERGVRPDGRAFDEVRSLHAEVGLFRRTHGSALFMRGDTQILAITTLASPEAEQLVETMETTGRKRFLLHYNFPGFATGEAKRSRGPGRREIGHGALAAKAVRGMLPSKDQFPYTIRVVAETLSSNGSSSMASTCATSLSLMDAGVPLRKPVAGIAMGLMSDGKGKYRILTDIQGPEDHYGDMDCKVAGTADGLTAIQMDVKIDGITKETFKEVLTYARAARLHILSVMNAALPAPRPQISSFAPTIFTITIDPEKIGDVIGPGGRTINGIIKAAGGNVSIDIEQEGKVYVGGVDRAMVEYALEAVKQIVREFRVGEIVEGPIVKILDFGAIVDLGGGRDGMIHVSELREGYVKKVEDVVKMGDRVWAKIVRVEEGRIGLSLKGVPQQKPK